MLVGFGQVICVPVTPRCDLCTLGAARICPSYKKVDPKSAESRIKVELLPEDPEDVDVENNAEVGVKVELDGPEGKGEIRLGLDEVEAQTLDW